MGSTLFLIKVEELIVARKRGQVYFIKLYGLTPEEIKIIEK